MSTLYVGPRLPSAWGFYDIAEAIPGGDRLVVNLSLLATIDQLVQAMPETPDVVKERLEVALRESMDQLSRELPEGVILRRQAPDDGN